MKHQFTPVPGITFLLMILFFPLHILAQGSGIDEISRINRWDRAAELFVRGDYAFVTTELSGLQILNISDPESPELVGYWDDNLKEANGIYVSGDFAYIADGKRGGLEIINISDPENPTETGYLETLSVANDVFVVGNFAYVAEADYVYSGIRVVDISDPENPQEVGFAGTFADAARIEVSGDYAYIATQSYEELGLLIFDISDPENPDSIGYFHSGESLDVLVSGNIAYLNAFEDADAYILSLDISDPTQPEELDRYELDNMYPGWRLEIQNDILYLSGYEFALTCFDVSDPENITFIDSYWLNGIDARGIQIIEDIAYIAAQRDGFYTVDISNPENFRIIGQFKDYCWKVKTVSVSEDIAVCSEYTGGTGLQRMIDISDLSNPLELEVREANRIYGRKTVFYDGLAYNIGDGLYIYDLSDPTHPVELSNLDAIFSCLDLAVADTIVYTTACGDLYSINVENILNPYIMDSFEFSNSFHNISKFGNLACIVNDDHRNQGANLGMYIVDVSDPSSLEERGFLHTFNDGYGFPDDVYSVGNYAYLTTHSLDNDDPFCLNIIDISDPDNPERVGFCPTPGYAEAVWVSYDYAYIADAYDGLRVIDISDPEQPEEVCWFDTPGYAWDVCVYGDLVYVADQAGMGIYDCSETINVVPQWVDIPRDTVEFTSGDLIEINLTARDRNDDELTLDLAVVDLPDNIEFSDNGDGSADFRWQTTEADSGIYHPIFIASDGELNDSVEVVFFNSLNNDVELDKLPVVYKLISVYPNPFNSLTRIHYSLDQPGFTTLRIFDIAGREVTVLREGYMKSGDYSTLWKGEDMPSGVYFCRLVSSGRERVVKVVLMK